MGSLDLRRLIHVGDTPLITLRHLCRSGGELLAKLEWYNPFGSVKDRIAYWMLKVAEERGEIRRGGSLIIEPTSGNTGIALAGLGKLMGYRVELVIPEKISLETKVLLRELGAELLETSDDLCPRVGKGTDQSIELAKAIVKDHPDKYFMPNQYENEANFQAHYSTTGPEIWRDTAGRVTHFITGIGTGGTITGVAQYLKEKSRGIKIVAVEPQRNHHIQGLRNLEESKMPEVLARRQDLVDEWIRVSDKDAFAQVRFAGEREGLLIGPSSGAVLHAALRVGEEAGEGKIVAIFADDGQKYWSVYSKFGVFTKEEFETLARTTKYPPKNLAVLKGSPSSTETPGGIAEKGERG